MLSLTSLRSRSYLFRKHMRYADDLVEVNEKKIHIGIKLNNTMLILSEREIFDSTIEVALKSWSCWDADKS